MTQNKKSSPFFDKSFSPAQTSNDDKKNPGLKKISKNVMQAVVDKGVTTYKEVAHIVSNLNENNPFDTSSSGSVSKQKQAN